MVIKEEGTIYTCGICKERFLEMSGAQGCELKGGGTSDIRAGEVFRKIDYGGPGGLENERAVLFLKDVSGDKDYRGLVTHFPYWRVSSFNINVPKYKVNLLRVDEIDPRAYREMSEAEFARAKEIFFKAGSVGKFLECSVDEIVKGEREHLRSGNSHLQRLLYRAVADENYEAAAVLKGKLIEGQTRLK